MPGRANARAGALALIASLGPERLKAKMDAMRAAIRPRR